jgi:hypothetical protein
MERASEAVRKLLRDPDRRMGRAHEALPRNSQHFLCLIRGFISIQRIDIAVIMRAR